jgi:hypothetical protein
MGKRQAIPHDMIAAAWDMYASQELRPLLASCSNPFDPFTEEEISTFLDIYKQIFFAGATAIFSVFEFRRAYDKEKQGYTTVSSWEELIAELKIEVQKFKSEIESGAHGQTRQ